MRKSLSLALQIFSALAITVLSVQSRADFNEGSSALQVNFGFTQGGMALGLDYEYAYDRTYGIGGYFRMYPENDNPNDDGITAIGAFIRPHFNRQSWDLYVSPGFGFISYEPSNDALSDETLMGPSFALGILYEFTPQVSFGVEEMTMYSWFGEDTYRGFISHELMAKFRFIF